MAILKQEIETFEKLLPKLKKEHFGKWVLIHDSELIGIFDGLENAAEEAVKQFGRGPYLIRQVGAPMPVLPASVLYHPIDAAR